MENYVESINNGKLPNIGLAYYYCLLKFMIMYRWNYVQENECINSFNECIEIFNNELMDKLKDDIALNSIELRKILRRAREIALENYFFSAGVHTRNNDFYYGYRCKTVKYIHLKIN